MRPFAIVLRKLPGFPEELVAGLDSMDPDERLPIATVHELLAGAIAITGDEDIGLKAACEISMGDHGALEYVASSAPTFGASIEVESRYMRLVNDALEFRLQIEDGRAKLMLDSSVVLPRAAADFQSGAFYIASTFHRPDAVDPEYEAWFTHPAPAMLEWYDRVFGPGRVRFDAPFNGFTFDATLLDLSLPHADPKLHAVIRRHAELLLAELPKAQSLTGEVRSLIAKQLEGGNPSASQIARAVHMSPRTFARRLEDEGTTFKELLDDMRRRLALSYVGGHDLGLAEIAFLLGFSQASAFHRAFKRWTGQTPLEYRRARRG